MAKEYVPIGLIKLKATTNNIYDDMKSNELLDRSTLYITNTPKTIREMFPFDIYLNYSNLDGYISVSNGYSDTDLISNGFAKINASEDEQQTLVKKPHNITDKFIIKISPSNNYFSLFVPVVDDV